MLIVIHTSAPTIKNTAKLLKIQPPTIKFYPLINEYIIKKEYKIKKQKNYLKFKNR